MSSRRTADRPSHPSRRSFTEIRRRATSESSLLLRHYALFTSLSRYALPPPKRRTKGRILKSRILAEARVEARARKLAQLQQKYPAAGLWAHTWPLPLSQLPSSSSTTQEDLDALVERIVDETFDADYDKFRSVEWGRKHKISKEHREQIIIDRQEVKESAEAAKGEVNKALKRFVTAVQRREIGTKVRTSSSRPTTGAADENGPPSAEGAATVAEEVEADIDEGLDEEIYGEEGDPANQTLNWVELLDFLQASAGDSKSAQWRNWHLLNAIKRTRERCEELFPHQAHQPRTQP